MSLAWSLQYIHVKGLNKGVCREPVSGVSTARVYIREHEKEEDIRNAARLDIILSGYVRDIRRGPGAGSIHLRLYGQSPGLRCRSKPVRTTADTVRRV